MGALITGLSSLIAPALSSIFGGGHTNAASNQNNLQSLATSQSGLGSKSGSGQPSTLTGILETLQKLEQSAPAKYAQLTGQIAANLQTAAQTASSKGNTNAANFLNQLASNFTNASKTGQLPSVQDLARAIGGTGGHHHHHSFGSSSSSTNSSSDSSSSSSSSSTSTTGQSLNQLLASLQNSLSQSNALNPLSIIDNTLTAAGVTTS